MKKNYGVKTQVHKQFQFFLFKPKYNVTEMRATENTHYNRCFVIVFFFLCVWKKIIVSFIHTETKYEVLVQKYDPNATRELKTR